MGHNSKGLMVCVFVILLFLDLSTSTLSSSDNWMNFMGTSRNSGSTDEKGPKKLPAIKWEINTPASGYTNQIIGAPLVFEDRVVVLVQRGAVRAYNKINGTPLWGADTPAPIYSPGCIIPNYYPPTQEEAAAYWGIWKVKEYYFGYISDGIVQRVQEYDFAPVSLVGDVGAALFLHDNDGNSFIVSLKDGKIDHITFVKIDLYEYTYVYKQYLPEIVEVTEEELREAIKKAFHVQLRHVYTWYLYVYFIINEMGVSGIPINDGEYTFLFQFYPTSIGGGYSDPYLESFEHSFDMRVWQTDITSSANRAPASDGKRVYVVDDDNILYALDRKTGDILWQFWFGETDSVIVGTPSISKEGIVLLYVLDKGKRTSYLYALSGKTGKLLWRYPSTIIFGTTYFGTNFGRFQRSLGYMCAPTVANGIVYTYVYNEYHDSPELVALDVKTGEFLWGHVVESIQPPVVADHVVYIATNTSVMAFFENGSLAWVFPMEKHSEPTGWISVDDGRLYVPTVEGWLLCLEEPKEEMVVGFVDWRRYLTPLLAALGSLGMYLKLTRKKGMRSRVRGR